MIDDPMSAASPDVYDDVDPDLVVSGEDVRDATELGRAEGSFSSAPPEWFSFRRKWELRLWAAKREDAVRTAAAHASGHCLIYESTGVDYTGFYVYCRRGNWPELEEPRLGNAIATKASGNKPRTSLITRMQRFMAGE
jgi:hypothetical protein